MPSFRKLRSKVIDTCHYLWEKIGILTQFKGFFKTPCFYYGLVSIIVLGLVCFGIQRLSHATVLSGTNYLPSTQASLFNPISKNSNDSKEGVLFFNQSQSCLLEPPELKIIQSDCLAALTSPRVLSTKVLGAIFGQGPQIRKEIIEYAVQSGDTFQSIAKNFDISLDTLLTSNSFTKSSKIKAGQKLIILPVTGLVHIVRAGDTLSEVAKLYKAQADEIIETNELTDESDVYIGDILVIPNGVAPKKAPVYSETQLANSYFKFPVEGRITQGLHWYNAVDIGNKCGTPIFAAAAGTVLKAKYGWNSGGGNVVTIMHKNGVVSYYGHLQIISVKVGDSVDLGDRVGLMGGGKGMDGAGISTGCHLHFDVIGAKNPFGKLPLGYKMQYVGE
ncbi:peptidoglycan DD-metalloendopeptidase family protein [Patescibacteria group bacterium]|nr:peptidoglycan DD-metalloendopeptidase family protein [Patescibacteria group bacterium]